MKKKLWKYNDGGRAAAGFEGDTGDCVVRAFSIALQSRHGWAPDYAYLRMLAAGLAVDAEVKQNAGIPREDTDSLHLRVDAQLPFGLSGSEVMAALWHYEILKIPRGYKPSWVELLGLCKRNTVMVQTKEHVTTIVNGVYHDTLDMLSPDEAKCRPHCLYVPDTDFATLKHRMGVLAKKARAVKL